MSERNDSKKQRSEMIRHRTYMRASLRIQGRTNSALETPQKVVPWQKKALNLQSLGLKCRVKLLGLLIDTQKKIWLEFWWFNFVGQNNATNLIQGSQKHTANKKVNAFAKEGTESQLSGLNWNLASSKVLLETQKEFGVEYRQFNFVEQNHAKNIIQGSSRGNASI